MDIWRVVRPKANDREMLIVGRVVVVVMVGIGIAWMPNVSRKSRHVIYYFLLTNYFYHKQNVVESKQTNL